MTSGVPSKSRLLGAGVCERASGPIGLCACQPCSIRRAVAVDTVGADFPSIGALLVRAAMEGA